MSSEDPFGLFGDPEELRRRMAEFAEQMQGAQRVAWADNAIKLAVDMTVAGINRLRSARLVTLVLGAAAWFVSLIMMATAY